MIPDIITRDRSALETFFQTNPRFYVYHLGDLDDAFYPDTTWFSLPDDKHPSSVALLFTKFEMPVVLHMVPEFEPAMNVGIVALFSRLPDSFYGHISPEFLPAYEQAFTLEPHGEYLKMALASSLPELKTDISIPLSPIHHAEVKAFADAHYPGNWFEPEMLDTGEYRGIRENGELIALAGVHAVSERYRGAALGNIITHTEQRSRGLGKAITLSVIHHLQEKGIETLGLNVRSDNPAAIRCYEALGFRTVGRYTEVMLRRR